MEKSDEIGKLSKLISNSYVGKLFELPVFNDEPKFIRWGCSVKFENQQIAGQGISISDEKTAKIKAIAECAERKRLADYKDDKLIKASANKLGLKNLLDKTLQKNSDIYSNTEFYWLKCKHFGHEDTSLPAQLVFVPFLGREPFLREQITSGAALHKDEFMALYSGICELIERDSFMLHWLLKMQPKKVVLDDVFFEKLCAYLAKYYLELHVFDITTNIGIPSFLAVIIDKTGNSPLFSFGLKAGLNPRSAVIGAVEEAQSTRLFARYLNSLSKKGRDKRIRTIEDRCLFWSSVKKTKSIDFILKTKKTIKLSNYKNLEKKNSKSNFMNVLKSLPGYDIYYVVLEHPKLKEAGVVTIKCFVPQLQPLHLNEDMFIKTKRLLEWSRKYKQKLNKLPHPFL